MRQALSTEIKRQGELAPQTCRVRDKLAHAYLQDNKYNTAESLYRGPIERFRRTADEANALAHAADFYWRANKINQCEKALRQALALRLRRYKCDGDMALTLESNLSTVLALEGKITESDKWSLIVERAKSKSSPGDPCGLEYCLYQAGRTADGIALCKQVIATREVEFKAAKSDADVRQRGADLGQWLRHLAGFYCDRGDFKTACALLERENQVTDLMVFSPLPLANIYLQLGQVNKAEELYKKNCLMTEARETNIQRTGRNERANMMSFDFIACAKTDLALFYYDQKRWKDAEGILTQLLGDISDKNLQATAAAAITAGNLAKIYVKEGRFVEAEKLLCKVQGGPASDCFGEVDFGPIEAFHHSPCDSFSSSGPEDHQYMTQAHQPRVDPVLLEYLWMPYDANRHWHRHAVEMGWAIPVLAVPSHD